jgi:hypothetical protein
MKDPSGRALSTNSSQKLQTVNTESDQRSVTKREIHSLQLKKVTQERGVYGGGTTDSETKKRRGGIKSLWVDASVLKKREIPLCTQNTRPTTTCEK